MINYYSHLEVVDDSIEHVLHLTLEAIHELILSQQTLQVSADQALAWLDNIMYVHDYQYLDDIDTFTEDVEAKISHIENYAPFMLKTRRHVRSSSEQVQLKTVSSMQGEGLKMHLKTNQTTETGGQFTEFMPIPLNQDRINTALRGEFMVEEQMRVKKKMELLELKLKHAKKHKKIKDSKKIDVQVKINKDLQKRQYTFDYDGGILIKKMSSPSVSLLKEICYSQEVVVTQPNYSAAVETYTRPHHNQLRAFSPSTFTDLYNNGGQRQTSMIPHIKLKQGVVLKEISLAGQEQVKSYATSQDRSLQQLNRNDYDQLSMSNEQQLMKVVASFHNKVPIQRKILSETSEQKVEFLEPIKDKQIKAMIKLNTQQQEEMFVKLPRLASRQQNHHPLKQRAKKLPLNFAHFEKLNSSMITSQQQSDQYSQHNNSLDQINYLIEISNVIKILDI